MKHRVWKLRLQKGFIDLGLLAIGALIVSAIVLPLTIKLAGTRVTTRQRAETCPCKMSCGTNETSLGDCTLAYGQPGFICCPTVTPTPTSLPLCDKSCKFTDCSICGPAYKCINDECRIPATPTPTEIFPTNTPVPTATPTGPVATATPGQGGPTPENGCPKQPSAPTLKKPDDKEVFTFVWGVTKVVTEVNLMTDVCPGNVAEYSFWAQFKRDDGTSVEWTKAYSTSTTFTHGAFYKTGTVTWKARVREVKNGSVMSESSWSETRTYRMGAAPTPTPTGTVAPTATPTGPAACVRPAGPTGLTTTCNEAGTQATVSWNAATGADFYSLRVEKGSDWGPPESCELGSGSWETGTGPESFCRKIIGTSYITVVTPGEGYTWWVHSRVYCDSLYWNSVSSGTFTCFAPTPTGTIAPTATPTGGVPLGGRCTDTRQCQGSGSPGCRPGIVEVGCYIGTYTCMRAICDLEECKYIYGDNENFEQHICKSTLKANRLLSGSYLCCPPEQTDCEAYCKIGPTPTGTIAPTATPTLAPCSSLNGVCVDGCIATSRLAGSCEGEVGSACCRPEPTLPPATEPCPVGSCVLLSGSCSAGTVNKTCPPLLGVIPRVCCAPTPTPGGPTCLAAGGVCVDGCSAETGTVIEGQYSDCTGSAGRICCRLGPTPTATPTGTVTPTVTGTIAPTATLTPTLTPTATPTPKKCISWGDCPPAQACQEYLGCWCPPEKQTSCAPSEKTCKYINKADGTVCTGGRCQNGNCVPAVATATPTPTGTIAPTPTGISGCITCPAGKPAKNQGNANCDDNIDLVDFELWRQEFLGVRTTKEADFNCDGDGIVDLQDFERWRVNRQ